MIEKVILRNTVTEDLEILFKFQLNEEARYLAAFTPTDWNDRDAYINRWTRIISRPEVNMQTIIRSSEIVGSIVKFEMEGDAEISYWIDKNSWGQGVAADALMLFFDIENARPLYGRVAFDNIASHKVLEKFGFVKIGTEIGFANARNAEIEEYIYKLE